MNVLYTHEDYLGHSVPLGHPECPDRLRVIQEHLQDSGIWQDFEIVQSPLVNDDVVHKTHPVLYYDRLQALTPKQGLVRIDADTGIGPGSITAVKRAAGAVVDATHRVLEGSTKTAFCLVRPPGHHAETSVAMGFCLLNSVAIAANYALEHVDRVAILDFDVHHCNGTVEIFQHREEVMVCSSFQYPYFPGRYDGQNSYGENIVNSPLSAGEGSYQFREVVEQDWLPALTRFDPQFILVSAGFDAHVSDPLGALKFTDADYTWITRQILDLANSHCDGKVVSALEGGYNLETLGTTVENHLAELLLG